MFGTASHVAMLAAVAVLSVLVWILNRHYIANMKKQVEINQILDGNNTLLRKYAEYLCAWCQESSHDIIGGPTAPMDYYSWLATEKRMREPPSPPPMSQDTNVKIHEDGWMPR